MFEAMLDVGGNKLYPELAELGVRAWGFGVGSCARAEGFFSGDFERGHGIKDL